MIQIKKNKTEIQINDQFREKVIVREKILLPTNH